MTLRDLFNAPTSFELDGETFTLAEPTLLQQGEYQAWLEDLALQAVLRAKYPDDETRAVAIQRHAQDCAAGVYEWGGAVCSRRAHTVRGFVQYLCIVCREQGMTERKAKRLLETHGERLAAAIKERAAADPKFEAALVEMLGLRHTSATSSSPSATPHSGAPATSPPSGT